MSNCVCGAKKEEKKIQVNVNDVRKLLKKYEEKKGVLVHALQDVQKEFGFLPEEALKVIAEVMDLSLAHVYGVASFYAHFYFTPRGKNIIKVCTGTACHVRGSKVILEGLEEELGIKAGETTDDFEFTLETVSCVGCCALAPVVVVNEEVSREKNSKKIIAILKNKKEENDE
ncbi:NADH-quinone oxidoreductase subunit NuoE [Candidatus Oleimmundimicrobium sp.]|uniref:NADH-quinone oxidoreductase subunit NuoE n=1 Tax=Candidatus Oleimmundimicrobium sp. TaxID=3060597 RepID=UPI0027166E5C|nr:NADH-quinone oxidoreductase subunit NuoE [Candidatus Oleimmundimicrobium sp.]MDO8886255.1 NADH-quinone oxidoreductase subunit NuoE [Candidatus Oleimmundimicrobium sp.]